MNVELKISYWWKNDDGQPLSDTQKEFLSAEALDEIFKKIKEGFVSGELYSGDSGEDYEFTFSGGWKLE